MLEDMFLNVDVLFIVTTIIKNGHMQNTGVYSKPKV